MSTFNIPTLIYLIGMPASGKSTFGKQLAPKINYIFFDTDEMIVEKVGKSISQIFTDEGEEYFRKMEREVLLRTINFKNAIVSTGGGAPCSYNNIDIINANGFSVFLDVSIDLLTLRAKQGKNQRPMFNNKSEKEIEDFLIIKLSERKFYYDQAHLKVNGDKINVDEFLNLLQQRNKT